MLKKKQIKTSQDILFEIFLFLDFKFVLKCRLLCKQWNQIIMNSSNIWENITVKVSNINKIHEQLKSLISKIQCNSKINNHDLENISSLTKLEHLSLCGCERITNEGLKHLINLISLQHLNLGLCSMIQDDGLQYLTKMESLESLSLFNCAKITDNGLKYLIKLKSLKSLNLNRCEITDMGLLDYVIKLKSIQKLDLGNCNQITDIGLLILIKKTRKFEFI